MKLKNVLVVVRSIEKSVAFYRDLFGLSVIRDFGTNVIMTEGLVLQERTSWEAAMGKESEVLCPNHASLLYFETDALDIFLARLKESGLVPSFVTEPTMYEGGKQIVRFYDLDGNLIEVGTP